MSDHYNTMIDNTIKKMRELEAEVERLKALVATLTVQNKRLTAELEAERAGPDEKLAALRNERAVIGTLHSDLLDAFRDQTDQLGMSSDHWAAKVEALSTQNSQLEQQVETLKAEYDDLGEVEP